MDAQNARDVTCTYAAARLSDGWAAGLVTIPETGRGAVSWHPKYDRVNHPTPISAKSVRALLNRRDPAITATACGRRHNGTSHREGSTISEVLRILAAGITIVLVVLVKCG
jgi:hypothetical protein